MDTRSNGKRYNTWSDTIADAFKILYTVMWSNSLVLLCFATKVGSTNWSWYCPSVCQLSVHAPNFKTVRFRAMVYETLIGNPNWKSDPPISLACGHQ